MKKLTLLLLFLASMLSSYGQLKAPAAKQRKVYINLIDGTRQSFNIWQVDSITFGYDEDDSLKADIISKPVDLGLSVKWASFNVGAIDSLSVGYLVGWGDATGLNRSLSLEYYPTLNPKGNIINTENDLAKVMWEDQWRMPTEGEIQELVDSCDWTYVHEGDARGYLVKSRKNENSIFLPLTGKREGSDDDVTDKNIGFYWSGILAENKDNAVMLSIRESGRNTTEMLRSTGLAIRPVYGDYRQKVEVSFDEANVKKDKTSATFPLNFTGSLSFVSEYGVAYATSEATLDVQGNSKVKVTGEPKESETIKVTGLEPNTIYYFKAYAITEGNYTESEVFTITTDAKFPIPEAVDLGLSVKWAKWNMGASSEYDSGDWYGWGDPTGEKTSTISSEYANGYTKPSICGTSLDIATQNWGEGWRLPTAEEVKELLDKCKRTAVTKNGVAGYNLTLNGQTIFLPKGGYKNNGVVSYENYSCYWTGEQDDALHPYELAVYSSTQYAVITNTNKALHLHIRPVYDDGSIPGGGASSNAYDKYAVDLGLSSLWSSVNLGATKSTGIGKYYAWGETKPKTSFKKEEYEYYDANSDGFTDIGHVISDTEYDAVKAAWGGKWHMPTYYDFQELCEQCTWTVVTLSGVQCFEVKGPSGKVIYLPMTGYYTSSSESPSYESTKARYWAGTLFTLPTSDPIPDSYAYSYNLDINGNPKDSQPNKFYRYWGAVIRPVRTKN